MDVDYGNTDVKFSNGGYKIGKKKCLGIKLSTDIYIWYFVQYFLFVISADKKQGDKNRGVQS